MIRQACINYFCFFLLVLVCGGGCMYAHYMPEQQQDLALVGLDEHTRSRLAGQSDPRPGDPEPTSGLSGKLIICALREMQLFSGYNQGHGVIADLTPDEQDIKKLGTLDGIDMAQPITFGWPMTIEEHPRPKEPGSFDFKHTLLEQARSAGGDLLLVYTTGHRAATFDLTLGLGQILLLGYCPTVIADADAQTRAVLIDVKTGYVYLATEGADDGQSLGIGWGQERLKANTASKASKRAFSELTDRLVEAWPEIRAAYGTR